MSCIKLNDNGKRVLQAADTRRWVLKLRNCDTKVVSSNTVRPVCCVFEQSTLIYPAPLDHWGIGLGWEKIAKGHLGS